MGRKEMAVLGGALSGLGKGLVDQDSARRKEAQEQRDRSLEIIRDKNRAGLLTSTVTDINGNLIGITGEANTKNLNIQGIKPGMTAEDARIESKFIKMHTKTDDEDIDHTDYKGVYEGLIGANRPDLAADYEKLANAVNEDDPRFRKAESDADKWINEQSKRLNFDSEDFADYGGNRFQAKKEKTLEFYNMAIGKTSSVAPASTAPAAQSGGTYSTPDDVGKAYQRGQLSQPEAEKILREQFGQI